MCTRFLSEDLGAMSVILCLNNDPFWDTQGDKFQVIFKRLIE